MKTLLFVTVVLLVLVLVTGFIGAYNCWTKAAPDHLCVYVDAGKGCDRNCGTSCSQPVASLRQALEVVYQLGWNCTATILLQGCSPHKIDQDTLALSAPGVGLQKNALVIQGVNHSPLLLPEVTVASVGTNSAGFVKLTIKENYNITNSYVGKTVKFLSGKNDQRGNSYKIGFVDNSTGEFTIAAQTITPLVGDKISIGDPQQKITFKSGLLFTSVYPVVFENLGFWFNNAAESLANLVAFYDGVYGFANVSFNSQTSTTSASAVMFENCDVTTGTIQGSFPGLLSAGRDSAGVSFYGQNGTANMIISQVGCPAFSLTETVLYNSVLLSSGGTSNLLGCILNNCAVVGFQGSEVSAVGIQSFNSLNVPAFTGQDNSHLTLLSSDVSGNLWGGVSLYNSSADIQKVTTDSKNKNGLEGLILGPQATAAVQISTTTLTGTLGDVQVGIIATPQAWSDDPRDDFAEAASATAGPYYASYAVVP